MTPTPLLQKERYGRDHSPHLCSKCNRPNLNSRLYTSKSEMPLTKPTRLSNSQPQHAFNWTTAPVFDEMRDLSTPRLCFPGLLPCTESTGCLFMSNGFLSLSLSFSDVYRHVLYRNNPNAAGFDRRMQPAKLFTVVFTLDAFDSTPYCGDTSPYFKTV